MKTPIIGTCILLCTLLAGPANAQRLRPDTMQGVQDSAVFRFEPGELLFRAGYEGNEHAIAALSQSIREHRQAIEAGDVKVRIRGFCTSFGTPKANLQAAKNRSNQVKSYFIVHEGLQEVHFRTSNSARPWRDATDLVAVAYLYRPDGRPLAPDGTDRRPAPQPTESPFGANTAPDRPDTSAVQPAPSATRPADTARPSGKTGPENTPESAPAHRTTAPASASQRPSVAEALEGIMSDPALRPAYRWAVKTNVAYLAATVANIGIEYSFGGHCSVDLPIIYSPYTVARDYRLRLLAVQPEFRYWLKKPMAGHFFGIHLNIGAFNIAVDDTKRYQSPDGFYGAGLSYGYMLPFARRWAAEFTIGAGYVHAKYDTYYNIPNGARFEKGRPYNYWGITKAGISLVYKFGKYTEKQR